MELAINRESARRRMPGELSVGLMPCEASPQCNPGTYFPSVPDYSMRKPPGYESKVNPAYLSH